MKSWALGAYSGASHITWSHHRDGLSWSEARNVCTSRHSDLVVIDSQTKIDSIMRKLRAKLRAKREPTRLIRERRAIVFDPHFFSEEALYGNWDLDS